ncbi:phosphotransferase [Actinospica durhamensis]|uniref:Phosphotransferase n=1 Tax=Actinospica durhamensis TaxID=1508375 RepID=A0A941ET59_9ACTN|nr:aminoglycoside phosphotransferase family protein [Actinospica durhamensis]MBR7835987.1 phosphotransferase [Actinospica durhamensis]
MTVRQQPSVEADAAGETDQTAEVPKSGASAHVSPTRRALDDAVVARLVAAGLPGAEVAGWERLSGGEFAAVVRVSLRDGNEVVLKVGPAPSVRLLRYEHGMIGAEARYLAQIGRALPDAPLATLLAHGGSADAPTGDEYADGLSFEGEWMLTSLLPGKNLHLYTEPADAADADASAAADPSAPVREQLGALLARVHTITSPDGRFGYDGGVRPQAATWPEAFTAIIESLLQDAATWGVQLPASPERIRALVRRNRDVLAQVERAALVHFDLWDGNVLAAPGPDGALQLTGIVDGERFLYGDPLVDFVSPALGRRIENEPDHPFLAGYRAASGEPARFTDAQLRRLALYRLHLALLMYVEMPSRGMDPVSFAGRWEWIHGLLMNEIAHLEAMDTKAPDTRATDTGAGNAAIDGTEGL